MDTIKKMSLLEEEKFRLEKELKKVCPSMNISRVYADYALTPKSNSEIWSRLSINETCLSCVDRKVAEELGNPEELFHHDIEHFRQRIKFSAMNPRVHPDSLEVYVPVNGGTDVGFLRIELVLAGYSLEFEDEDGGGTYDVFDLQVQETVSKGGSYILKKYVKDDVRAQVIIDNTQKVHSVQNMLVAKFNVENFESTENFIHQSRENEKSDASASTEN